MNDTGNGSAPDNPMGTDGFEFVEYTAPDPALLGQLFDAGGALLKQWQESRA